MLEVEDEVPLTCLQSCRRFRCVLRIQEQVVNSVWGLVKGFRRGQCLNSSALSMRGGEGASLYLWGGVFFYYFVQGSWLVMIIKSRLTFSLFHYCFKISIDSVPLKVISPLPPSPQYPTAIKWRNSFPQKRNGRAVTDLCGNLVAITNTIRSQLDLGV